MSYPSKETLKAELKSVCGSDSLCEALASQFGGVSMNCNHRVPQMAVSKAQTQTGASDEDAEGASTLLCSYVDTVACQLKK